MDIALVGAGAMQRFAVDAFDACRWTSPAIGRMGDRAKVFRLGRPN